MNNQSNNSTNSLSEQALNLLERYGWSIIPIGSDKRPLIAWKPYQKIKPTPKEIEQWFAIDPNANIGVVTGAISDLTIIDIDPRHNGTDKSFRNLKTIAVKTGGGGYHYYFKYEKGIKNGAGLKPGIDIRSEGGYVVVPPSLHQSGNYYEWIQSPENTAPLPIPDFVKSWIKQSKKQTSSNTGSLNKSILQGVSEGQRNNSAASVIGKLFNSLKKNEWEAVAWPLILAWNDKNTPPLAEHELRNIFESIRLKELQNENIASETETPPEEKKQLLTSRVNYPEVEEKVLRFLPNSQVALKIILAVSLSCNFKNSIMLWLLLVGVPSSGKTDLVRLIKDADCTYYLDNLTQNAFISGERASRSNKVYDLLPLLNKKCLVIKDWTAIFSLDEKMTKKLLGDLVGIYDREFTKFSSRRGNVSYKSAFAQLGCITPSTLNKHTQYMNMVGPRFLCYTLPPTPFHDVESNFNLIFANADRSILEKEARLYVSSYLNQLTQQSVSIKSFKKEVQAYLRTAAILMSNCRGIVILQSATFKNEDGEDVKYFETLDVQTEEPWRAIQQLIELSKYLAIVVGKDEVGVEELEIIKEVVISSMPADRSQALRAIKNSEGNITAKQLSDYSEKSAKTGRRLLDELCALKVLDKTRGEGSIAADYKLKVEFKDFVLLDPAEYMSAYSRGTETPPHIEKVNDGQLFDK
ncbi:hypothetical protein A3C23_04600 [Candidatus Roizmanbacteria bacterium RIFCSPHIGHO2_02_FULL_37_13b]|uniref:DNA primase/polymerase bifunctional N-terminal domain-containing protein n=1 Tax=Candidatus Roizmanbacteria bacterium RIFCSPLOWO2_02_FULL_36_11 TaxID=1802071 RepID=A0A1F7JH97_9BACT|nr:MAG: hypothetical protein A3C23_04600 [Candidatus Roizmanbacteria bacterium RIFCSPHIGHO2_02_FULL_37_13b]OGK54988.1 MAG: hypothetical protein A3H78_00745 [Candidatus Roizmanbacteria bacterium RIFCSPLOWO2_02_FULL_36_11]